MNSDLTPSESVLPSRTEVRDRVVGNPYLHFMLSEAWSALAGISVYATFRFAAYVTQFVTAAMPLNDTGPALFLETISSWCAAIGAAATFIIISLYQLVILIRRLWERVKA